MGLPLEIPPGCVLSDSPNAAKGRYTNADKMRFVGRHWEKWGGWQKKIETAIDGAARGATSWSSRSGDYNVAVGTFRRLYVMPGGDSLLDITPNRDTGTLTNPFTVTADSDVVAVADTSHGLTQGAIVEFDSADVFLKLDLSGDTAIGDMTGDGGLDAAIDGTTAQAVAAAASKASATEAWIGVTGATAAPIYKAIVYGTNDAGYVSGANPEVTIELYGKNGTAPASATDGTLLGTLAAFTDTADESGNPRTVTSSDTATEWDHRWVRITHDGSAATMAVAEVEFYMPFTIDGEYIVQEVTSANGYTITAASAAVAAASGGGSVNYVYKINPGNKHPTTGQGWGTNVWGGTGEGWGDPTGSTTPADMRIWSVASYGTNLLALPHAGTLYDWTEGVDTLAQPVTNAPVYARAMFVTPERFVFLLGTDSGTSIIQPMQIQWPDQDDITDWTPTDSNTANIRTLQEGSKLIAGVPLLDRVSLVWSDTALYAFQYTGSNAVYEDRLQATNCGLVGALAFCVVDGIAYWMSSTGFHMYTGSVQDIPNAQDIEDYVFSDINTEMISKVSCVYNLKSGTIIWNYVSNDAEDIECDKYIELSLDTYSWTPGTLNRCCATIFRPAFASLLMWDQSGYCYEHEIGKNADGEPMEAFITYGLYALSEGDDNVDIGGFVTDFERQVGTIEVELFTKDRPNAKVNYDSQTVFFEEPDTETYSEDEVRQECRISGRYFGFTITTFEDDGDVRGGICQIEVGEAGKRSGSE